MTNKLRDINKYSFEYMHAPFLEQNVKYRRRMVSEQISKYPHRRILEIGCGMFPFFSYLDSKEYLSYTIVEPVIEFAENAEKTVQKNEVSGKVTVLNDYMEKVDLAEQFDFIICSSLLHEVEDSYALLKKIRLVCSPNTVVHINVPNAYSIHRLIAKETDMTDDIHMLSDTNYKLQQRKVYDLEQLKRELSDCGFSILDSGSYFVKPFTHRQMSRILEEGIIDEKILDGLYKISKYIPEFGSEIYVNIKSEKSE